MARHEFSIFGGVRTFERSSLLLTSKRSVGSEEEKLMF